ncbi:GGDEF domain-containing protein [Desulfospira joergensenii]|uniref:GGDEF domain-containing protein n=1 Tax=Desulfospira joergensenii TaxID=53329 RepID=UPI0003B63546|nr:GGDEF domain-containing protein [Desulfospira joergensenii]
MISDISQKPRFNFVGEFRSRDTESCYQEEYKKENRRRLIFICIFTSLVYFLGIIANAQVLGSGNRLNTMLVLRLLSLVLGFTAALFAWKKSLGPYLPVTIMTYMIMVGVSESVEAAFLFDTCQGVILPTTPIIVLMYYLFISIKFTISFIPSMVMSVLYTATLFLFTESPLPHTMTIVLFFFLANLYGSYHLIHFNRIRRSEFFAVVKQQRLNDVLKKEINARQEVENKLIRLSTLDDLTGIYNRRHFLELFSKQRKSSVRYKRPLSLLLIDVDHFKRVNDTHGHDVGDIVLQSLTKQIAGAVREMDILARFGGEEFIVLLPETDLKKACRAAERICRTVEESPVPFSGKSLPITVSIGVAAIGKEYSSMDEIIKGADLALYRAKESGRNRVCSTKDME